MSASTPISLNNDQGLAMAKIQQFLADESLNTFLLKGYAGTGKTFLMQELARELTAREAAFGLLASTGRAASVLRGKTGFEARTVHGELYHFQEVEGDNDQIPPGATADHFGQMLLQFALRPADKDPKLYIIDEASMLSSEFADNPFASFGSGVLLEDFFSAVGKNKVIFVGDPCQLPPVGQSLSPALDELWLQQQGRKIATATLQHIERTDTDILLLATSVRNMSTSLPAGRFPKLPVRGISSVQLHMSEARLLSTYIEQHKQTGATGTLAIARSNRAVQQINRAVRTALHGAPNVGMKIGETLLVTQNNYAVPLTNGDFVTVTGIGPTKLHAGLHFQQVTIKTLLSGIEYTLLLSLDILYGEQANFTTDQQRILMIDFSHRMREQRIRPNSDKYKEAMKHDEYLNCLRATYGYAVTCHKAQGGEWNEVFLFMDKGMYGMPYAEMCRWWYTAITRARRRLHLHHAWWLG